MYKKHIGDSFSTATAFLPEITTNYRETNTAQRNGPAFRFDGFFSFFISNCLYFAAVFAVRHNLTVKSQTKRHK